MQLSKIPIINQKIDFGNGIEVVRDLHCFSRKVLIETDNSQYCVSKLSKQLMDRKVLIVDDTADILELMTDWFERLCKYDFITVSNAYEAERIIETEHVILLVTDLEMPDMDGLQLLRWCSMTMPHIKRVLMSGNISKLSEDQYSELQISKPVSEDDIKRILRLI